MEELLRLAQPDIRRYARRHCAATMATDDVVQETLIIVCRRVGTVRSLAAFGGWLVRVVQRVCIRPVRGLLGAWPPLDEAEDSARFSQRPEHDLRLDLARAIEALPPIYRDALLMRDFEELTIEEMASRLGATREATKSRLHRARFLVREQMTGSPPETSKPSKEKPS